MKKISQTLKELIKNKEIVYLVGAGCSVDPPSSLPAGQKTMEYLTQIFYPLKYQSVLLDLIDRGKLRFEQMLENITYGKEILEYFDACTVPNSVHFFLADSLLKEQFVITTNFDNLIELALTKIGVPPNTIKPIITQEDLENYQDFLSENRTQKDIFFWKIHGSLRNVCVDPPRGTPESLIITIKRFGQRKEQGALFSLEPYKIPLFMSLLRNKTLVIVGYSGSDDFDVMPQLKITDDIKEIVWINHVNRDQDPEIVEINETDEAKNDARFNLVSLKKAHPETMCYFVEGKTSAILACLRSFQVPDQKDENNREFLPWLETRFKDFNNELRHFLAALLFYQLHEYDLTRECANSYLLLDETSTRSWEMRVFLGVYYYELRDFENANQTLNTVIEWIGNQLANVRENDLTIKDQKFELIRKVDIYGRCFLTKGFIKVRQHSYQDALKYFRKAKRTLAWSKNYLDYAICLSSIGEIYLHEREINKAVRFLEKALRFFTLHGNLKNRISCLMPLGLAYMFQKRWRRAITSLNDAKQIGIELNDKSNLGFALLDIGIYYSNERNPSRDHELASKKYFEAFEIFHDLERDDGVSAALIHRGQQLLMMGKYKFFLRLRELDDTTLERLSNLIRPTLRRLLEKIHMYLEDISNNIMPDIDFKPTDERFDDWGNQVQEDNRDELIVATSYLYTGFSLLHRGCRLHFNQKTANEVELVLRDFLRRFDFNI